MNKVLVLVICILISESILTGLIPHSRGYLFYYLGVKSGPVYFALLIYFCNYLFLDFFQAIKSYFILKLSLKHRHIRTEKVINNVKEGVINTPQRIQEDIKLSYVNRFTVWAEYFVSTTIVIQLLLINISEPLLILSALGYAALSVLIAYRFNPRLTEAEKEVQQKEASYRANLAKSLTLDSLPSANKASLFAGKTRMQYLLFTKLQLGFVTILPYLVLMPSLLSGVIDLGTLIKHQSTFALIVVNAAILIQYYTVLIQGHASEQRVKDLDK